MFKIKDYNPFSGEIIIRSLYENKSGVLKYLPSTLTPSKTLKELEGQIPTDKVQFLDKDIVTTLLSFEWKNTEVDNIVVNIHSNPKKKKLLIDLIFSSDYLSIFEKLSSENKEKTSEKTKSQKQIPKKTTSSIKK